MSKVAIVTGASSGIGLAVSKQLLEAGCTVYGFSRRGTSAEGVKPVAVEITDEAAVKAAVDSVAEKEGRIDILINNAGMGISGPVEFTSAEDMKLQMEVNYYGQVYCAKAVLPHMRRQGSGRIVCTSSVAAVMSIPYQSFYSSTKAAVSAMALALRNEVKNFGIQVCAVMPGDTKTGFTDARIKDDSGNGVYTHNASAVAAMEKDERGGMTPEYVASVIVKAATVKNPKPLYTAGAKFRLFVFLFRFLPYRFAYWVIGKMYS
ncbi:MAG: SDR family oxidoreductase [Oscillospiraceae bacterium]|nr:SDR family oxidoreductase [Oscillospiraceae bacterium]